MRGGGGLVFLDTQVYERCGAMHRRQGAIWQVRDISGEVAGCKKQLGRYIIQCGKESWNDYTKMLRTCWCEASDARRNNEEIRKAMGAVPGSFFISSG